MSELGKCMKVGLLLSTTFFWSYVWAANSVDVWVTSNTGKDKLTRKPSITGSRSIGSGFHIQVDRSKRYQNISGFGAAITSSTAYLLYHSTMRKELMEELFGNTGIGISYIRLPMGACDFQAAPPYTYADSWNDFNMDHFSIQKDKEFIIPIIKEAMAINPSLGILASPWTAPAWMKTSNNMFGGSFRGGSNYQQALAKYFLKFVQAYQNEGIPIDAVTVQNEPNYQEGGYPTMLLSWQDEKEIVKFMGPLFRQNNIHTKILVWDHNWDNPSYPGNILSDPTAAQYVDGSAWHCYSGRHDEPGKFHDQHPTKDIYFTECSGGGWRPGFDVVWFSRLVTIGQTRNWAKSVLLWNIALDDNNGPKVGVKGCSNCRGFVTVHPDGWIDRNCEFYVIGHFSKFVKPGAVRLETTNFGWDDPHSVAFQNRDGSVVVVVLNPQSGKDVSFYVAIDGNNFQFTLAGTSLATFVYHN